MSLPANLSTTPDNPRHHFDRERQLRFLALLSDCGNVPGAQTLGADRLPRPPQVP